MTMDAATASPQLIRDLLRVTGQVPELTVVIDHLPQMNPPEDAAARKAYESDLVELAKNPRVFV